MPTLYQMSDFCIMSNIITQQVNQSEDGQFSLSHQIEYIQVSIAVKLSKSSIHIKWSIINNFSFIFTLFWSIIRPKSPTWTDE